MKRVATFLALALTLALAGSGVTEVHAMLTVQEQEANRKKKEAAKEQETETETAAAPETEQASENIQSEAETIQTEAGTEAASETEKVLEDAPLVAIDPGHQAPEYAMSGEEPKGPGSQEMKAKTASGTTGCVSGLDEYELDLMIALKLRDELEARGYRVLMTRENHETSISNVERCQMANEAGADILLRIHANGSEDGSISGALTTAPSQSNPYLSEIYNSCIKLADDILTAYCEETGLINQGLWITDDMTGMNWSEMPVTILEMGYMSNPGDDAYMADEANQEIMVTGIANGVDRYFGR